MPRSIARGNQRRGIIHPRISGVEPNLISWLDLSTGGIIDQINPSILWRSNNVTFANGGAVFPVATDGNNLPYIQSTNFPTAQVNLEFTWVGVFDFIPKTGTPFSSFIDTRPAGTSTGRSGMAFYQQGTLGNFYNSASQGTFTAFPGATGTPVSQRSTITITRKTGQFRVIVDGVSRDFNSVTPNFTANVTIGQNIDAIAQRLTTWTVVGSLISSKIYVKSILP